MDIKTLTDELAVSSQILPSDIQSIHTLGFRSIICNRPDNESSDQPLFQEIEATAKAAKLAIRYQPVSSDKIDDADASEFGELLEQLPKPILAFCRTGTRSASLWALAHSRSQPLPLALSVANAAGYDVSSTVSRIANGGKTSTGIADIRHDIVIIGAGAAGVAVASGLLARNADLDIAVIDPADVHYYQPGWTLVGAGVFAPSKTVHTMASVMPDRVKWIKAAVAAFEPSTNSVILEGGRIVRYKRLVVCPGLKLDWHKIEGLVETLGHNGVTSNYRFDLAPYTWKLVSSLRAGRAIFTQSPMPIKCAGAPQKAMYLSADHWYRTGDLKDIEVAFYSAAGVLFGVPDYLPALMEYVKKYRAGLNFHYTLTAIDGPARKAYFKKALPDKPAETVEVEFDMIHVTPPQCPPDFVSVSPLADAAGWIDVDHGSLRHKTFSNIWSLGDACSAPNAKTAAAARKQAPVVAENICEDLGLRSKKALYDGYGSCPLTVERGKIVLAEFGYGGKLLPSFPQFILNGKKPTRLAWLLKERILPSVYWHAMLKGREWMAEPHTR
ncbi:bifunctional protein tyrosine phosphatase family protein/NAD(P)/FAD-dependent oxidoreductase [Bradyrhizobium ottawaense]|uniref:bifunctional protein tyrosine phosphatase family protein/NAD(P)/FAD-dependent oxidoreductase n=1 Tax=Bradyrhizobium ottawaense TaxID=931866 RepID=UPI000417753D|nr:bifunctional protein tyrosine phosphatase family protein/NAD(P)/FAD-dependent oxidoreductase [Bradyrhizobium ottawaense]